jgi:uncharacterized membrane protein
VSITIEWLLVALRWTHIVAILGWVGSSFYFVWLDSKLRTPEPARENVIGEAWMGHGGGFYIVEKRLISGSVPSPLYWFRNEAAITWVTGFLLLVFAYYWSGGAELINPQTSVISPRAAVALAIAILPLGWLVYDGIWKSRWAEEQAMSANVLSLLLLFALTYCLCYVFNGRAAFIHVGAVVGTNMVASVWTRIIPAQEEAVAATRAGRPRDPVMAARARRRALHNTYLTLPVIFTMVANHAPNIYGRPLNWVMLVLLIVIGISARHMMLLFDRRRPVDSAWFGTVGTFAAAAIVLAVLSAMPRSSATGASLVPFSNIAGIIDQRCSSCHSQRPSDGNFLAAPAGVMFDTPEQIVSRTTAIRAVVSGRTMPPGNSTGMTNAERDVVERWIDTGAQTR